MRVVFLVCLSATAYGQSQDELDEQELLEFRKADRELTDLYNYVLASNKDDTLFLKDFQKTQSLWLEYRDAVLETKYPIEKINEQGSVRTMCYFVTKTYLSNQRIKELKEIVISEEGDVCR